MAEQDQIEPLPPATRHSSIFYLPLLCFAAVISGAVSSCSDDKRSMIGNVDPEQFPTMMTKDVSTLISDSGYTRYHITADSWLMFDEAEEPHWTFPHGLFMEKYDNEMAVQSTFRSDSASYLSQKRIWEFNGNVRMRNVDGDRFATEQLFWNQQDQKVYSDSFIHIERIDRILEGYGFVSNEQMTEYTILNVSGIFPTPQRKEHSQVDNDTVGSPDSTAVDTLKSESVRDNRKKDRKINQKRQMS